MVNGRFYGIFIDSVTPRSAGKGENYKLVACATDNGFSMSGEGVSYNNKSDDGFDQSYTGRISTSFNMSGQAVGLRNDERLAKINFNDLTMLMINKKEFWLKQYDPIEETIIRETWCRIGSYEENAPLEGVYTFTASFVGIGRPVTLKGNIIKSIRATDQTGLNVREDGKGNLLEIL